MIERQSSAITRPPRNCSRQKRVEINYSLNSLIPTIGDCYSQRSRRRPHSGLRHRERRPGHLPSDQYLNSNTTRDLRASQSKKLNPLRGILHLRLSSQVDKHREACDRRLRQDSMIRPISISPLNSLREMRKRLGRDAMEL